MKKLFFTALFSCFYVMLYPQYITLKNKQLYDQSGQPFFVKGVNYLTDLYSAAGDTTGLVVKPSFSYYNASQLSNYNSATISDVSRDFKFIHDSLGCNTIRLVVGNISVDNCNANYFTFVVNTSGHGSNTIHTNSLAFLRVVYKQLLDSAAVHSINVILLMPGQGASCSAYPSLYSNYLAVTAAALNTKTALLAYDEWNEPGFENFNVFPAKSLICSQTKSWYNTLKTNDPNHLVTVGLWEAGLGPDATHWGTDVYKADFYAFHVYPQVNNLSHLDYCLAPYGNNTAYEIADASPDRCVIQNYKDRYNACIKWIQNTTNLPWLVGETGFSAPSGFDCSNPSACTPAACWVGGSCAVDGDESQQADFVNNVLTQNIQAGGMGSVFWQFKDVHWNIPNNPKENYWGMVDSLGHVKTAGHTLNNFTSNTVTGPPAGYPTNYKNLLGNTGTAISGSIGGIKDAVISGWHIDSTGWLYPVQTISDAGGNFTITSKAPVFPHPNSTTAINHIEIGAIGYDVAVCDGVAHPANLYSGKSFSLNKAVYYDDYRSALSLDASCPHTYAAPDILCVTNLIVDFITGGGCTGNKLNTFTAGREVCITGESYVGLNAEAAFYISTVDVDCSDGTWGNSTNERKANTATGGSKQVGSEQQAISSGQLAANSVKTVYLNAEGNFSTQIYPNPASDKIYINAQKSINFIILYDGSGKQVYKSSSEEQGMQSIDMAGMAPGVYTLRISYTDNSVSISQIIKQ